MRLPRIPLSLLLAFSSTVYAQDPAPSRSTAVRPAIRPSGDPLPQAVPATIATPTGFSITPTAAPGSTFTSMNPGLPGLPNYLAGQPMTMALGPDGKTLLVLTSGYNLLNGTDGKNLTSAGNEYVFIYDISTNQLKQLGVVPLPAAYAGIAWNPKGTEFYVSGGAGDLVFVITLGATGPALGATIPMGHATNPATLGPGLGLGEPSIVAGLSVNPNGTRLLVANHMNDSVSLVDLTARKVITEYDLRPGVINPAQAGTPGGEYPFWTVWAGNNKAYVSSMRDREIVALNMTNDQPAVTSRIKVSGNPNKMILNRAQNLLFATEDNADAVVVIDTAKDYVIDTIYTTAPTSPIQTFANFQKGSNPNSLALSPDQKTLYVTNAGTNSLAVVALHTYQTISYTTGLIPTGWYPQAVTVSPDGTTLFVANAKNVPGPNPGACKRILGVAGDSDPVCLAANQYVLQLEKGGLSTIPVPDRPTLDSLTQQVATNNNFTPAANHDANAALMAQLRAKIQHVIYIVKENRTYDEILGDLPKGNGDPAIALFSQPYTPNQHQIASQFITLDNFYDSGEVSGVGWNWSTAARATDYVEKTVPPSYAGRFGPIFYDYEGANRNLNIGLAAVSDRVKANPLTPMDPNQLPGNADVAAPDSSEGAAGAGYLWDDALATGLTVRNYGFYLDLVRYELPSPYNTLNIPPSTTPFASGMVQAYPAKASLQPVTDPYFRGFDNNFPDFYRYQEWAREFDGYVASGNLPSLSLVRFMHDHTGNYGTALYGVNVPEAQVADNDYAVGLLLEHLSKSPYAANTLVFVIEDDAQDGPDHVDAHRSTAYIAGPYVKQGAVVSTRYNTVNFVRTIKDVLGIPYFGITDGTAEPMADVFDLTQATWTYNSIVPGILRTMSTLPLPAATTSNTLPATKRNLAAMKPKHSAQWWAKKMAGQDFDEEDKLDTVNYNLALWQGMKGKRAPYPEERNGRDLSENRDALLKTVR
jgi:DNA-binding beta-propeller fold protein YncE